MSEILNPSKESSSDLVGEIVELRQVKSDRNAIIKRNQYYVELVSQLEIKVSELKAQLIAKDYEIQVLSARLLKANEKNQQLYLEKVSNHHEDIFNRTPKTNDSFKESYENFNTSREECSRLKTQLQEEKKHNEVFENQLKQLGNNILSSNKYKKNNFSEEKIKKLQREIAQLTDENLILKSKFLNTDTLNQSTANKSLSSDLKISTLEIESNVSISPVNSTPRNENHIPELNENNLYSIGFKYPDFFSTPKKQVHPEPPKTRSRSEYPKKPLNAGKPVKHINLSLTELLKTSPKPGQLAGFCPTSMRKARRSPS